ncbi:3-oxoacyl-[acyl-carrier-protein] reductase FabG [termite gut metagenome]|uniref:3-oxoacyl-[acyl-carrier-protein] reductase FabG n=1 Tax=termite gut metagenome TaxID=433724 RepID=A0A5J4R7S7_9ZZZZ
MIYNPFSLEEKTILVTGASSGIGQAIAIECSKMGASLVITGRNQERLNQTFDSLKNNKHVKIVCDLNKMDNMKTLVDELPILDGIVHAAGIVKTLPFQFINSLELNNVFNVNFLAPVLLSQSLVKNKKLSKNSSVIFISSIDGPITVHIGNSMYSASKGAVTAIARNMAVDLAAKKIRVNCILPGMTETPLIHSDGITQEQLDLDMKLYPLKRYGKPEDIAYAAIYLLSDASSWVTGTNLIIDGGFTLL